MEAGMEHEGTATRSRGLGRFTGWQLTTIICVAIVAIVTVPTVALAASGAFTSTTVTPAVTATNSAAVVNARGVLGYADGTGNATRYGVIGQASGTNGIGVQGGGTRFGVYSNGPLGVAAGKPLACTGCVGLGALSAAAKPGPMDSGIGETQEIVLGIGTNDIPGAPAFVAPANERCLVTTTGQVQITSGIPAPAGHEVAQLSSAISVNGAPYVADGDLQIMVPSTGTQGAQPPATFTSEFSVSAGQTIRFAASDLPIASNTAFLVVRQGYICS
jgi:hypothetical protein